MSNDTDGQEWALGVLRPTMEALDAIKAACEQQQMTFVAVAREWASRVHSAEAERDALRERMEELADEWAEEGPALVRNAHDGSYVTEGQTLERCARSLRIALDGMHGAAED